MTMAAKATLLFGCCILLMLLLGQFFIRKKGPANFILVGLLISCCIWSYNGTLYLLDVAGSLPHLNKIHVPFLCATGPLLYLYNKCLFDNYQLNEKSLLHAVPSISCMFLSIPFYVKDAAFKIGYVGTHIYDLTTASIYMATRIAELTTIVYLIFILLFLQRVRRNFLSEQAECRAVNLMFTLVIVSLFAGVCRLVGAVYGISTFSVMAPCILIFSAFVILYCFSHQYPKLLCLNFTHCKLKVPKGGNAKLLNEIEQRILKEKLYLDPNITLHQLAKKLRIQGHSLSELINNTVKTNFNCYLNTFRVEHAKKLLLKEPNLNILQVAYDSGFNSKSVFYKHFTKATTVTPSDFRKQNIRY